MRVYLEEHTEQVLGLILLKRRKHILVFEMDIVNEKFLPDKITFSRMVITFKRYYTRSLIENAFSRIT